MIPRLLLSCAVYTVLAVPALSHEFWIKPQNYQVESGKALVADLLNGEGFEGSQQVYFQTRTARSELIVNDTTLPYQGRMGDLPALQMTAPAEGLAILLHQTEPASVKYKTWDDFTAFAAHKGFADIVERHDQRSLSREDFWESYSRFAKTLIAIGNAQGQDRITGLDTEFVAQANPYIDDLSQGFPVRLLYQGKPRSQAQVEVFERAPDGTVTITMHRTDADGLAVIPVKPRHEYLLDAVVLRPAPDTDRAVWETLWASLTFHVP